MRQASIALMAGGVLLVGCSGGQNKDETKAPASAARPIAAEPRKAQPAAKTALPGKVEAPRAVQPLPPAEGVTPVASAPTNRPPIAVRVFTRVSALDPKTEAGMAIEQAQALFRQGETNAALKLLSIAVKDPACETGRDEINRKLLALLLASGRVDDAETAALEYAASGQGKMFGGSLLTGYLLENGDAEAAVAWTEQVRKLSLPEEAATQNLKDGLTALAAAGRLDEASQRLPALIARTNETQSANLVADVVDRLIVLSRFDQAEAFLNATDQAAGGKHAYTSMVANMRLKLDGARTRAVNQAPVE